MFNAGDADDGKRARWANTFSAEVIPVHLRPGSNGGNRLHTPMGGRVMDRVGDNRDVFYNAHGSATTVHFSRLGPDGSSLVPAKLGPQGTAKVLENSLPASTRTVTLLTCRAGQGSFVEEIGQRMNNTTAYAPRGKHLREMNGRPSVKVGKTTTALGAGVRAEARFFANPKIMTSAAGSSVAEPAVPHLEIPPSKNSRAK
ncbi:MAG: hypothetical protein V4463_01735 [Pseudomonadota bacterium]